MEKFYTYITYNSLHAVDNIGVTNNLRRRIKLFNQINKNKPIVLVYFEEFTSSKLATQRENFLKSLQEQVLLDFVLENNPMLINLIDDV